MRSLRASLLLAEGGLGARVGSRRRIRVGLPTPPLLQIAGSAVLGSVLAKSRHVDRVGAPGPRRYRLSFRRSFPPSPVRRHGVILAERLRRRSTSRPRPAPAIASAAPAAALRRSLRRPADHQRRPGAHECFSREAITPTVSRLSLDAYADGVCVAVGEECLKGDEREVRLKPAQECGRSCGGARLASTSVPSPSASPSSCRFSRADLRAASWPGALRAARSTDRLQSCSRRGPACSSGSQRPDRSAA
jgi:hypothetical protein